LQEGLRQTRVRLDSGNVTATDVSQSESRLAVGRTAVFAAQAAYEGSKAVYRQVIGLDPNRLLAASPVDRFIPGSITAASTAAISQHPNVASAQQNVDAALIQVKVAEGALYPTLTVQGSVQKNYEQSLTGLSSFQAAVTGQLSVPIYQGGAEYSAIRQAKETQAQRQLDLNVTRDQTRANLLQAWAQLAAAKSSIESTKSQVKAAEAALNGVREEARLGQRTTLDVLNAQQELVTARISLVSAQRDRVLNSYSVLSAIGRLSPQVLGLTVPGYDASVHYHQVRDAWFGVRTPDGR
jgi:outer membrane protein